MAPTPSLTPSLPRAVVGALLLAALSWPLAARAQAADVAVSPLFAEFYQSSAVFPWAPPVQSDQGYFYGFAPWVWSTPKQNGYGLNGYILPSVAGGAQRPFTFGETTLSVDPRDDDNVIWFNIAGTYPEWGSTLLKTPRNEFVFSVYAGQDDTGAQPSDVSYGSIPKTSYLGPYDSPEYGGLFKLVPQADGSLRRKIIRSALGRVRHPGALAVAADGTLYGLENALPVTEADYASPGRPAIFKVTADDQYQGNVFEFPTRYAGRDSIPLRLALHRDTASGEEWLYGLASRDVFRVRTDGSGFAVLHTFADTRGPLPESKPYMNADNGGMGWPYYNQPTESNRAGGPAQLQNNTLLIADDGWLYANFGRGGLSQIFRMRLDGSGAAFVRLGATGEYYEAYGPMVRTGGYLYGTAQGSAGNPVDDSAGVLYRIDLARLDAGTADHYEVLYRFGTTESGYLPTGLMQAADGRLYGTTLSGGKTVLVDDRGRKAYPAGTLFAVDLAADIPKGALDLSISASVVELGQSATLRWEARNAGNCRASGDWDGARDTSGEAVVQPALNGTYNYVLTCDDLLRGPGYTVSRAVGLTVPAPQQVVLPAMPVHEGGGGLGGALAGLLFAASRRRPHACGARR